MTVELLRAQPASRIDPNFGITLVFSLLGLTVTLALLPLLGMDIASSLAIAG